MQNGIGDWVVELRVLVGGESFGGALALDPLVSGCSPDFTVNAAPILEEWQVLLL